MKIVEFFLIIWGKWSELEPEPEFLTSWSWSWSRSWSRTKIDRLRNTGIELAVKLKCMCRKIRSEKEVRKRLESIKGKISEENSFAFMFACCGRGEGHYRGQYSLVNLTNPGPFAPDQCSCLDRVRYYMLIILPESTVQ
jgi:hypothetical protein